MNRPTWDSFVAVNSDDKQTAFESLARMLFKAKYNLEDNLSYFKNHAGNETNTIRVNDSIIGFQAKYFEGAINKAEIMKSMNKAKANNPSQTDYIIYTNSAFGNPPKGKNKTKTQSEIEEAANDIGLNIEWWFGDNILDAASRNQLIFDLFFNTNTNIRSIHSHISQENDVYLSQINNSIKYGSQEYSFQRKRIREEIESHIRSKNSIVINGESGSGKSALIKLYYEENKNSDDFAFYIVNAANFDTNAVNDIFKLQIDYTIVDFTRFYQSSSTKVFVVDSAEKLLTNKQTMAFYLAVNELLGKGWSIIFTCRDNTQLDLYTLLTGKMSMKVETINVPQITREELNSFSVSNNIILPTNSKLCDRLTNLFFLARYCELQIKDITRLTLKSYREEVWRHKIGGGYWGPKAQYREECILNIVKDQIENNRYYTPKAGINHEAAYCLISDDVLTDNGIKGYSVKHDLYFEWAIDQLVEIKYVAFNHDIKTFIENLGTSQTSINAFGRWFEAKIEQFDAKVIVLVADVLFNGSLSDSWQQIIIKCICSSTIAAQSFFSQYKESLIKDEYRWLNKFITTMSISCQRIDGYFTYNGKNYPRFIPIGGCWQASVQIIDEISDSYYMKNLKYVYIVLDNYYRAEIKNSDVTSSAAKLSLRLFDEIAAARKRKEFFVFEKPEQWCVQVCNYAIYLKTELTDIFNQVIKNRWFNIYDPYYELTKYLATTQYPLQLLKLAISNMSLFLTLLEELWFYQKDEEHNYSGYIRPLRYKDPEWYFGLNEDFLSFATYMPASALQTPVLFLLQTEEVMDEKTHSVLDFIIRIANRSAKFYQLRHHSNDKIYMTTIGLPTGGSKKVISSYCLWNLYRGSSDLAMPYLLQSIHMALEKYLLNLMREKDNKEKVRSLLHIILENAETCSLISIVASLVCAYPDDFFEESLLLMQDIRNLEMDMMRFNKEISISSLDFAYNGHQNMWEERKESRELRHRKTQLENILTNYQVAYGEKKSDKDAEMKLNSLYEIVDMLKRQINSLPKDEQELVKFVVARIDYKNMKREKVMLDNNVEAIMMTPNLTKEQQEDSERVIKQSQEMMRGISLRLWIENQYKGGESKIPNSPYDGNIPAIFTVIKDIKDQLVKRRYGFTLLPGDEFLPAMASALLLIKYNEQLDNEQLKICHDEVTDALTTDGYLMSSPLSGFEICIDSLPVLINMFPEEKEKWLKIILMYANKRHETGNYRACDKVRTMICKYKLWDKEPEFMEKIVHDYIEFINNTGNGQPNIEIAQTILSLIPSGVDNMKIRKIALIYFPFLAELWNDKNDSLSSQNKFFVSYQIADYILRACNEDIEQLSSSFVKYLSPDKHYDPLLNAFIIECCDNCLYDSFWKVWSVFYDAMKTPIPSHYHAQELSNYLLNPDWLRNTSDDWFHFERKDVRFYEKVARDMGQHPVVLYSIVKAFTTFAKDYFEDSIPIIHSIIIRSNMDVREYESLIISHLEMIIEKVFTYIPDKRKEDNIFNGQIKVILDFMTNHGSQIAYQFLSNF